MNAEELYYICCERLHDDMRVAEYLLVGCIHELTKRYDNEVARDMVQSNIESFYIDKYKRELQLIADMKDDSLSALIASSLDLSLIYKLSEIILCKIELCDQKEVTANGHAHKAERIWKRFKKISEKMKKTRRNKQEGLF